MFLNESFLAWKNVVPLLLVCFGIWLLTKEDKPGQGSTGN